MILPNFLVIGAEKAGTTALTQFLRQHPNVCFSRPKETFFFNREYERGLDYLASHFNHWNGETAIGEGTVRLLQHAEAPARIHNDLPEAQFICVLRDPVDRAFSQYHYYVYSGSADPDRSFSDVIRDPSSDFGKDLIRGGQYVEHLRRYEALFGREPIHVILYSEFQDAAVSVVKHLYQKIGVDPSYTPETAQKHNVTKYPSSRRMYAILRKSWQSVSHHVEHYMPRVTEKLRRGARQLLFQTDKPTITGDDVQFLKEIYAPLNCELEDWMGRDLSHWA